jgi:hypothetical protein
MSTALPVLSPYKLYLLRLILLRSFSELKNFLEDKRTILSAWRKKILWLQMTGSSFETKKRTFEISFIR